MDIPARIKAFVFISSLTLIFFIVSLLPISKIYAQTFTTPPGAPTQNSTTSNPTNSKAPNNLHNWTQTVMIEVMSALTCQIAGVDPVNPKQQCLGVDQASGTIGFVQNGGGAVGVMGHMITSLYTPPIHTSDYFQNLAQNFGIVKKSYAQTTGSGFNSLAPLLPLWTSFRNIVYLLFVIVFVAIGLAIMLRVKVDPRTVMTIQNQIPKIIVGILLVTFSYAIAGFLVDMMYVTIHITGNLIVSADPDRSLDSLPTTLSRDTNPFAAAGRIADPTNPLLGLVSIPYKSGAAIGEILASLLVPTADGFMTDFVKDPSTSIIGFIFDSVARTIVFVIHGLLAGVIGMTAIIVVIIALVIALFRLWFTLIFSYISILIDIVLAPFWILGSLVPGSPFSASGWARDLIANLSAFPATIAMFLLGREFMNSFDPIHKFLVGKDPSPYFVPPLIGDRGDFSTFGAIIGLGFILMTPNVLNMLKAALKAPKVQTGIGGILGAASGAPQRAAKFQLSESTHETLRPSGIYTYKQGPWGKIGRMFGT